jgi:hypothetical protein
MTTDFSHTRCEDFINRMKDAIASHTAGDPHGGHQNDSWPDNNETFDVAQEAELTMADFTELDEHPGRFDHQYRQNGWHMCLRQLRNDRPDEFFDYLNRVTAGGRE